MSPRRQLLPALGGFVRRAWVPGRAEALAAWYPICTGLVAAVWFGASAGLALSALTLGVVLWGAGMGVVFGLASLAVRRQLARRMPDERPD